MRYSAKENRLWCHKQTTFYMCLYTSGEETSDWFTWPWSPHPEPPDSEVPAVPKSGIPVESWETIRIVFKFCGSWKQGPWLKDPICFSEGAERTWPSLWCSNLLSLLWDVCEIENLSIFFCIHGKKLPPMKNNKSFIIAHLHLSHYQPRNAGLNRDNLEKQTGSQGE